MSSLVDQKVFGCVWCGKLFLEKSQLTKHSRVHQGVETLSCGECGKEFDRGDRRGLAQHQTVHTGAKMVKCQQCGRRLSSPSALRNHMRRLHPPDQATRFKCEACSQCFAAEDHLIAHARLHTGERPYRCEQCSVERRFALQSELAFHVRAVHSAATPARKDGETVAAASNDGSSKKKCDLCEKLLTERAIVAIHCRVRSVNELVCGAGCGRSFRVEGSLLNHYTMNSKERPHVCDYCDFATFTSQDDLFRHVRKHIAAQPYSCDGCKQQKAAAAASEAAVVAVSTVAEEPPRSYQQLFEDLLHHADQEYMNSSNQEDQQQQPTDAVQKQNQDNTEKKREEAAVPAAARKRSAAVAATGRKRRRQ